MKHGRNMIEGLKRAEDLNSMQKQKVRIRKKKTKSSLSRTGSSQSLTRLKLIYILSSD